MDDRLDSWRLNFLWWIYGLPCVLGLLMVGIENGKVLHKGIEECRDYKVEDVGLEGLVGGPHAKYNTYGYD